MTIQKLKRMLLPSGRGSVTIIAIVLFSSASIRVLTSGNEVFAQASPLPTGQTLAPAADEASSPRATTSASLSSGLKRRDELAVLIKALTKREVQLAERERVIAMRLQALSIADDEIEKRMTSLSEIEKSLRATLALADEASENDLIKLTSVYENMKPKDAAALFEQMNPNFAAGFLGRMRPEVAASVMAGLTPEAAYSISVILAGRNANVPKT